MLRRVLWAYRFFLIFLLKQFSNNILKLKKMRTILFRGQRVDNKQWVEGYLVKSEKGECYIFNYHFIPAKSVPSEKFIEVVPETVFQFTNILDIEGAKIFEGDILTFDYMDHVDIDISRYENTPYYVVKHSDYSFFGEGIKNSKMYAHPYRLKHCKKLGNIFDNAEMLSF